VQSFSIADFFAAYPKTLHHSLPTHSYQTAPTNVYPPDFSLFSRAYHGHITAMRQYREFEATWQRWRKTGIAP
jgi:hypothetical protein